MIHPTQDRILLRRIGQLENSIIVTPEAYQGKARLCEVLAVGPGRWIDGVFCKTAVKPGDRVILPGIGSEMPDYEFEDGTFLAASGDIGAIVG